MRLDFEERYIYVYIYREREGIEEVREGKKNPTKRGKYHTQ